MDFLLQRPRMALAILALLVLAPGPLLLRLTLDNAPESYFPKDSPSVRFNDSVREDFPLDQVIVALFEGAEVYGDEVLGRLDALVTELQADERVERVLAATTVDHIRATADGFTVDRLLAIDDGLDAAQREARARSDRFAAGSVVGEDSPALAVVVRPWPMETSLERLELEQLLRSSIARHDLEERLTGVAGHIALDVAQLRSMLRDVATLVPGTLGISLLLLWWLFRRWLVLGLATAVISAVTGFAVALLVILDKPFTLITAIVPPLLTAITVAMLMHLFNAVAQAAPSGRQGRARIDYALDEITRPTLYTALTTAAGLLSLTASPIRPIETFGLISACGVALAALLVVFIVPALLLAWDKGPWTARQQGMRWLDGATRALLRVGLRRPIAVLIAAGALLLAAVSQLPRIDVETDLYEFFAEDHPIIRDTQRVEERLTGVMPLEVVFEGPGIDSLQAPERLRAIADVQAWLDAHPAIAHSVSLPELVSEMHWAFHGEDAAYRAVPDDAMLVAQYLFIYDGIDLYEVANRDFDRSRILLNLSAHSAGTLNALLDDLEAYLQANPPADLSWDLAGMGRLFADQERLLIRGQLHSLYAVVVFIVLLMLLMWRRASLAVASMVPNLAPLALIFGAMGLLGIWLDMATAMVASVAVGIALDDTIHVMDGYQRRRAAGASTCWALARTVRQRGRAVCATTVVLVGQFVFMAVSPFQPTAIFGWLTAFGLVVAMVFDLLVLPAILILQDGPSRQAVSAT
ncbi:MAG: MMPL family transporter [Halieaceae bacterium]|jgi:predicted RND superfamily exporter protein|nr:MMPL family transporter [Halieaceae bacterium]